MRGRTWAACEHGRSVTKLVQYRGCRLLSFHADSQGSAVGVSCRAHRAAVSPSSVSRALQQVWRRWAFSASRRRRPTGRALRACAARAARDRRRKPRLRQRQACSESASKCRRACGPAWRSSSRRHRARASRRSSRRVCWKGAYSWSRCRSRPAPTARRPRQRPRSGRRSQRHRHLRHSRAAAASTRRSTRRPAAPGPIREPRPCHRTAAGWRAPRATRWRRTRSCSAAWLESLGGAPSSAPAPPQGAPGSSAPMGRGRATSADSRCLGVLELAASKAAYATALGPCRQRAIEASRSLQATQQEDDELARVLAESSLSAASENGAPRRPPAALPRLCTPQYLRTPAPLCTSAPLCTWHRCTLQPAPPHPRTPAPLPPRQASGRSASERRPSGIPSSAGGAPSSARRRSAAQPQPPPSRRRWGPRHSIRASTQAPTQAPI